MRPGFSVHKVVLLNPLQVFVLLQVLAHLHMFRVGLEVRVGGGCRLFGLLQLGRDKAGGGANEKPLETNLSVMERLISM